MRFSLGVIFCFLMHDRGRWHPGMMKHAIWNAIPVSRSKRRMPWGKLQVRLLRRDLLYRSASLTPRLVSKVHRLEAPCRYSEDCLIKLGVAKPAPSRRSTSVPIPVEATHLESFAGSIRTGVDARQVERCGFRMSSFS